MYHKAKLRRAIINIDLGRLDEASKSLAESLAANKDPRDQAYASYWVMQTSFLKANETALRDCGQKALAQVARIMGEEETANALYSRTAEGPHGFTAAELHAVALESGFTSYPVQAILALDALPVPFIAHYNDKHYVTVEAVTQDTVKLYDSRISTTTEMPRASFEKDWSGFALLVKEPPLNEGIHAAQNLEQITGGCCGLDRLVSDLGDDDDDCESCGLPTYSVNPINMNFKVKDTPMWWDAPVGPSVYMTLLFNSQDSQNSYIPFGEKWAFEYASYLLITPSNATQGGGCQVRDGDGRMESFTLPAAGSSYPKHYGPPPGDFRTLVETSLYQFDLTEEDGTVYHYGIPVATDGNSHVPLLLSITDRHNNSVTISHNANGAITKIRHSALPDEPVVPGQPAPLERSWNLIYSIIGSVSRCTEIRDPFGRVTVFSYDPVGRLVGQVDMGGLPYSYEYTTSGALFVKSITTPTGSTSIHMEPSDGIDNMVEAETYSSVEKGLGYSYAYPVPGKAMWDNYRITIKDHLGYPTEYFYCAATIISGINGSYIRNAVQLKPGTLGEISPFRGSRTRMTSKEVDGKGAPLTTSVYDELGNRVTENNYSYDSIAGYSSSTRKPTGIPNGNDGKHIVGYNDQGKPRSIKLNGQGGDSEITIGYEPNGIDVDFVKRPFLGADKILTDNDYYPNSRDLKSITDGIGRKLTFVWSASGNGQLASITDSLTGDIVTITYDLNFRPYQVLINAGGVSPNVVVNTTVYDDKGNLQSSLGLDQLQTVFEYDNLNRLTKELHADNSFTAYQWACCYIESTRFGKMVGTAEKTLRRTVTLHDKRVLPISMTSTDGGIIGYRYDEVGQLIELKDAKNQITKWKYNGAGQMTEKTYPDNSKEKYTYRNSDVYDYGMGKLANYTNRRNQITTFSYEDDGKVRDISNSSTVNYVYDSWRRIQTVTQGGGTGVTPGITTIAHDLLGRITSIDGPWTDDTISYVFNDAARSVTRTSPDGTTQTTKGDAYGRIASIANALGAFTHVYGGALPPAIGAGIGQPLSDIIHSETNAGFNTAFTYLGTDFNRALDTITSTKPGGATVAEHSYTYNPLGNIAT